jgi:uncharacterized protein YecT (DUF1311 family)
MKFNAGIVLLLALPAFSFAQITTHDISAAQLQAILDQPLDQAIKLRDTYKVPLKAAYERQVAMTGKDCHAEAQQDQQSYNICIGHAGEQANKDYAIFYNNLQMLCHSQDQLTTLQASEKQWQTYKDSAMKATYASWSEGTGAGGFASQVYLSLMRDRMNELYEIYGLNIKQ